MPLNVGILGATGTVGQKFIECLQGHPYFVIHTLGASAQSAGKPYKEAVSWKLSSQIPQNVQKMVVQTCEPQHFKDVQLVFSALDANVAGEVEIAFASAGIPVFSNARNHRYDDTVPILIPYVNAHQIDIIPHQKAVKKYPGNGYIVTNANCSSTGLVVALKPILDKFGIEQMIVFTMQAISGAGYPGVASLDIVDNVVPFISGEEPKMELEPGKILGGLNADKTAFVPAPFKTSAHCNRVCVVDGHMECVSIKLKTPDVTPEQVIKAINEFKSEAEDLKLPSAPARPLVYLEQENRPQPRLDRGLDNGYTVTVGRVRKCPIFDIKLTLCSHNTVIGAAGGSILNAEVAVAKKLLPDPK